MQSDAWKCRCATLNFDYGQRTYPAGRYNQDYTCEAKSFFTSLLNRRIFSQVGGWVSDCRNTSCSGFKPEGKCTGCTSKDKNDWCDQCISVELPKYVDRCTCKPEFCPPFFKERRFDEWKSLALEGKVPLINPKGGIRAEAKEAKRLFGISDGDFAKVVKARTKILEDIRKAVVEVESEKED